MTEHLEKYYMEIQHSMTEKMHRQSNSSGSKFEGEEGSSFRMMSLL